MTNHFIISDHQGTRYERGMTILNLMLGKKRGGLEQAAIDYAEALELAGIDALTVTSPDAWVNDHLHHYRPLRNMGAWDPLAANRLRRLAYEREASAIICHGNRALGLALAAVKGEFPIIATAHNYKTKRFAEADAAFCITAHAISHLAETMPREKLFFLPNMVRLPATTHGDDFRTPPVIGSMGRFVSKKGFPLLVDALALLNQRGIPFNAIIGGGGEEEAALRSYIAASGLTDRVTLPGWVENKYEFLDQLDLFVLPSHHEPFGIVLIEAMSYALPVISTRAEGPVEIISDGHDGILTPLNDAASLADAIAAQLANPTTARTMAKAARTKVAEHYSPEAMATRLKLALHTILH